MIRLLHSLVTVLHFSLYMKKAKSSLDRSSRSEVFCEKVVLKNFAKFTQCRQFCKKKKLPCDRLVRSNFINESASWLLKNTKKWGWQILAVWKGFCWRHKCCDQQKMKVKKIQTQLYHSIEDKKPCKNHVKTITWKCHVFKMYTFN